MKNDLGLKLKKLRNSRNISQNRLANALKIKRYQISDWEQGRSQPSIEYLKMISSYFGISLDILLDNKFLDYFGAEDERILSKILK